MRSGCCPPLLFSPAVRPVIAEVTRWKSIGDALAPTDPSPSPIYIYMYNFFFYIYLSPPYSKRERSRMTAYSPTTCLAAGAERGVCILWNITGDSSRSALLQCCPAPTGAAVSMPITVWRRRRGALGSSRVILLHQSETVNTMY